MQQTQGRGIMKLEDREWYEGREPAFRIVLKGRQFEVFPTGLEGVAFRLRSGELQLRGIRNVPNPNLILCINDRSENYATFLLKERVVVVVRDAALRGLRC
jgi:hypothetical protein